FKKNFGAEMSLGAVYSSLPGKTDPQFNALFNWKNEAGTVGLIAQPFYEKRDLRRDGVEELQYERIGQQFPNTGLLGAYPQLAGVYYPEVVSSALFTQKRTREGGIVDLQFKPSANATLDLNAFYSHMDATNTNVAYMLFVQRLLNYNPAGGGTILQPGFNVKNGTLTSASFAAGPTNVSWADSGGYEEEYYRKAYADSGFIDLDGKFNLTDNLVLKTQLGATRGHGVTQEQDMWAGDTYGTGGAYTLNGTGAPTNSVIGNAGAAANPPYAGGPFVGPQSPAGATQDWFWGSSPGSALDREDYAQADGEYTPNGGLFTAVKFGARFSKHEHDVKALNWHVNWANYPASGYWPDPLGSAQNYPGNFGSGLGSGFINNAYYWSPSQLQQQDNAYAVSGANNSVYYPIPYNVKENDTAAYVEGKMAGEMWSGNIGVRLVGTQEKTQFDSVFLNNSGYGTTDPTPHLDSAWAPAAGYYVVTTKHNYVDVLPSANFKFELAKDVTLRLSANRSMSRPDYGAIGSNPYGTGYNDQTLTGSGGNPNLKPIVSNNLDSSLEWYFSSRGLASISLFNMDLTSYVGYGTYVVNAQNATLTQQAQHANPAAPAIFSNYTITAPLNVTGYIRGVELAYQQPIGQNFGIDTNLTYATGQETDNHCEIGANVGTSSSPCDIIGNSRITYNLSGYYEDDKWNARLTWSYRSSYYTGFNSFGSPEYQDGVGTLAASLGYKINDNMSVHLDLLNLNDPISKFYSYNKDQPLGIYDNGRQYY
ncbi:MAG: TonB-dependent receptor, partial [Burkholderiales bacterium]|nr:TonB-dependent receptor [Burkholderiales bacterium]